MNLQTLLQPLFPFRLQQNHSLQDFDIISVEMDHRKVLAGALFVCLRGFTTDGHQFAQQAIRNGAVAIISEQPLEVECPVIIVPDSRRALAVIADRFYQSPTNRLRLIGVTGTNGKSTTTNLIEKILEDQGKKTGRIGTLGMKIGDTHYEVANTTPESLELQKSFQKMCEVGSKYAVVEVSSHAIDLGRVRGCNFGSVVFTNLTQDHLDYHGTMEAYKRAKGLIFAQLGNRYTQEDPKYAILNADDEAHIEYQRMTPAQVLTYGIENKQADLVATNIRLTPQGSSFTVEWFDEQLDFEIMMVGKFNIYNVLGAIGAGIVEGIPLQDMKDSLEQVTGIPGRMETVEAGQNYTVIVDYAHTPDSLENTLTAIQEFAQGHVYCLIGCGGNRDRSKRPLMAQIALQYADLAVFTSDNPRHEPPEQIIEEMVQGVSRNNLDPTYKEIVDREEAIRWVITHAQKNDVVLLAGKGHETYQTIGDRQIPFDDKQVAMEAIKERLTE